MPVTLRTGGVALALFLILLVALPLAGAAAPHSLLALAGIFYKAGALVFGGGHVVLPLLRDALVPQGWLSDSAFLAGYGVAQAIPGPLFTFSAYLGAIVAPAGRRALLWSGVALVFMFLPGLLIALAGLPVWLWLGHHPAARAALAGINAAVVGVLGAALYNPIWLSAVGNGRDVAIALAGFLLLERWRVPPLAIVIFCVGAALISASFADARGSPRQQCPDPDSLRCRCLIRYRLASAAAARRLVCLVRHFPAVIPAADCGVAVAARACGSAMEHWRRRSLPGSRDRVKRRGAMCRHRGDAAMARGLLILWFLMIGAPARGPPRRRRASISKS